jgi:hypothetical protein
MVVSFSDLVKLHNCLKRRADVKSSRITNLTNVGNRLCGKDLSQQHDVIGNNTRIMVVSLVVFYSSEVESGKLPVYS